LILAGDTECARFRKVLTTTMEALDGCRWPRSASENASAIIVGKNGDTEKTTPPMTERAKA